MSYEDTKQVGVYVAQAMASALEDLTATLDRRISRVEDLLVNLDGTLAGIRDELTRIRALAEEERK